MERLIRYPIFILGLALLGACSDQSTEPPDLVTTCLECHRSEGGAAIPGWPPLPADIATVEIPTAA